MKWFSVEVAQYIKWIESFGIANKEALQIGEITVFVFSFIIFLIFNKIFTDLTLKFLKKLADKSKTNIDDILFTNKVPVYFIHIIPVYLWLVFQDNIFNHATGIEFFITIALKLYIDYLVIRGIVSALISTNYIYENRQSERRKSIKSYIQVFQLLVIFVVL